MRGWVITWLGMWGPQVSDEAEWKVLCQLSGLTFAIPLCLCKLCLGGSSPCSGGMLILAIGLNPAYMPFSLFCIALGTHIVLGRGKMKGEKGRGGRSGLPRDHMILLSAGGLFLVNMPVGRNSCCCAGSVLLTQLPPLLLLLLLLLNLECIFTSSDTPSALPYPCHFLVLSSK